MEPLTNEWNKPFAEGIIDIVVDGEIIKYDPETGRLFNIQTYINGESSSKVQIYKTGRGVIKFLVDGVAHRAMDVIHQNFFNVEIANARGYPANGNFTDLRIKNIVMVRTRAPESDLS